MIKFLLWCILFVLCWPLALLGADSLSAGVAGAVAVPGGGHRCGGVLELVSGIIFLPARLLREV